MANFGTGATRRAVLAAGAVLGMNATSFPACAAAAGAEPPIARIGVVSDIHLDEPERAGWFRKALEWFRDEGVDGVVVAGDIANRGRRDELELCARVWFDVFPDDTAPDGRHVERLFIYGNHDVEAWWWHPDMKSRDEEWKRRNALGCEGLYARAWEECFHEPYSHVWRKDVKGIPFVGFHWQDGKADGRGYRPPVEEWMALHGGEFDPSLPFFVIQHPHPKDTVYGPDAWGHDEGGTTRALAGFPNAVVISGHSHYSLTDERGVWQGSFTSIGASSLYDSSVEYAEAENGNRNRFDPVEKDAERRRIMRPASTGGHQGMLMDVFRDRLAIRRRCFVRDAPLGDDWIVPLPASPGSPFAFPERAARRSAPEFPDGATVSVSFHATPPPCARKGFDEPCARVSFPGAVPVGGCRTFEYDVRAVAPDGRPVVSRRVLAPDFNAVPPDAEPGGECLFAQSELPPGVPLRFEVRPVECFGRAGAPVVSAPVALPAALAVEEADTWGGRREHPAVVNPVAGDEPGAVVSLRGEWEFSTRGGNHQRNGVWKHFQDQETWPESRTIRVPGCWEAQGVGAPGMSARWDNGGDHNAKPIRHRHVGNGWYRKTVPIPSSWAGKRIWLRIGGARACGWFWVNGRQVALVGNYCGTGKFEITDLVAPGAEAVVVAQVSNARPSRKGQTSAMHRWGGLYRDVELEATPETFIDDAWVRGDFDGRAAEAHVAVAGPGAAGCRVRFTADGRSVEAAAAPDGAETVLRLPLPDLRAWSPGHPNLYTGVVELVRGGAVVHERRERFGVRKLEVRGKDLFLNGEPFFVRGFGDDSIYPLSGHSPADRDFHRAHLAKAREAGFNFARLHTHCEVPEYFEAADELGVLVQPELPYYSDMTTEAFEFDPKRDLEELWRNYRRHPSFAVYSMGNEGSFGPVLDRRLHDFAKAMDPDRLKINQDCHEARFNPPEASDWEGGPTKPWPRGSVDPDRPFVCHEYLNLCVKCDPRDEKRYTGVWQPPATRAAREKWLAARGLGKEWADRLQDAQHALQRHWQKHGIESARKDPFCDGYWFWTIVDVVVEQNGTYTAQGLFNPFWEPKRGGFSAADFARFNGPSCVLLDIPDDDRRVYGSGDVLDADFLVAHYGGETIRDAALDWRLVSGGRTLAGGRRAIGDVAPGPARKVAAESIAFPDVDRPVKATLVASVDGIIANGWDFWIFPRRSVRDGRGIAVAPSLFDAVAALYSGISRTGTPEAANAAVVIAEAGSPEVDAALSRGCGVVAVGKAEGVPNASLGWWFMGDQVGTALLDHPVFGELPHEGFLSPLLFRVVGKGRPLGDGSGMAGKSLLMVGEGGTDCYAYVAESARGGARLVESFGLDLLSGKPEAAAVFDGMVARAREKADGTETPASPDGLLWIDGRDLPLEGRAFDDTATYYERLPANVSTNVNSGVRSKKRHTAGMQFRFSTDSRKLVFRWKPSDGNELAFDHMPATGASGIDVYRFDADAGRWRYVRTGRIEKPAEARLEIPWTPGDACLVNLPLYNGLESFSLGIESGASVRPAPPRRSGVEKPVVFYGTSITQGGCASRPGAAFVNIVGRDLDVPVVNLGFSGSGVMEREMSDLLARIDASCYVLDCLWNMGTVTGDRSGNANGCIPGRNVEENLEPFLRNLRAKRPGVPIVLAEQSDVSGGGPNVKDRHLRALYERLLAEGWTDLVYLPKRGMYGPDGEGTVDGIHASDAGMASLAKAFGRAVAQALGLPRN